MPYKSNNYIYYRFSIYRGDRKRKIEHNTRAKDNQNLSQKTSHTSPLRANWGVLNSFIGAKSHRDISIVHSL